MATARIMELRWLRSGFSVQCMVTCQVAGPTFSGVDSSGFGVEAYAKDHATCIVPAVFIAAGLYQIRIHL